MPRSTSIRSALRLVGSGACASPCRSRQGPSSSAALHAPLHRRFRSCPQNERCRGPAAERLSRGPPSRWTASFRTGRRCGLARACCRCGRPRPGAFHSSSARSPPQACGVPPSGHSRCRVRCWRRHCISWLPVRNPGRPCMCGESRSRARRSLMERSSRTRSRRRSGLYPCLGSRMRFD